MPAHGKTVTFPNDDIWSAQEAKAKLSEILRLARAGKPQTIGRQDPCVVAPAVAFAPLRRAPQLGAFLLMGAPKIGATELPTRADPRGDPVADR